MISIENLSEHDRIPGAYPTFCEESTLRFIHLCQSKTTASIESLIRGLGLSAGAIVHLALERGQDLRSISPLSAQKDRIVYLSTTFVLHLAMFERANLLPPAITSRHHPDHPEVLVSLTPLSTRHNPASNRFGEQPFDTQPNPNALARVEYDIPSHQHFLRFSHIQFSSFIGRSYVTSTS